MIKHTIKEIADFFGCSMTSDFVRNGYVKIHKEHPVFVGNGWVSFNPITVCSELVSDYDIHDWKQLVEPDMYQLPTNSGRSSL